MARLLAARLSPGHVLRTSIYAATKTHTNAAEGRTDSLKRNSSASLHPEGRTGDGLRARVSDMFAGAHPLREERGLKSGARVAPGFIFLAAIDNAS